MANHLIAGYSLLTDHGGDYAANRFIKVYWNDSSEEVEVYVALNLYSDPGILQTSGPGLGFEGTDYRDPTNYEYQFCDGDQLNSFTLNPGLFPYVEQHAETSVVCTALSCDLFMTDPPSLTEASNAATNDGAATVYFTSSNGPIKFELFDFDYATQGQLSGTFTGLYGAEYTIYIKDSIGCQATITVTIPISNTYGYKYFMEWSDLHGKPGGVGYDHKVELWERSYEGDPSELRAAGAPFVKRLNTQGTDIFYAIRATELEFSFISQQSFQYHDLFTEDDRQFLVKYFVDSGSGYVQEWAGYLIPFFYSEQYVEITYKITVSATCGLANLKDLDFVDQSGNRFTGFTTGKTILTQILKKLDLSLSMRSGINMFDANFDQTSDDDPLPQAYYDVSVYYDKDGTPAKCDTVVKNILMDYTAAIAQTDMAWTIWRPEEMVGNLVYREFDTEGEFVESDLIDPQIILESPSATNRLCWKDKRAQLDLLPSYGTFIVRQKLIAKKSLLQSYSFEEDNIVPYGAGQFFEGWSIGINQGSGMTWGMERVSRGDSKGAMYINFAQNNYNEVLVKTTTAKISWTSNDTLQISFDYLIDSAYSFPWVRIRYKIKIGDKFFTDNKYRNIPMWSTTDYGYHEIYAKSYNQFVTFQRTISDWGEASFGDDESIEVTFVFDNREAYDVDGFDELRDITTAHIVPGVEYNQLVRHDVALVGYEYIYYALQPGVESDDPIDFIQPGDFSSGNQQVWKYGGYYTLDTPHIKGILLDNVVIKLLPNGEETPESWDFTTVKNPNNKRTLLVETFHGDCPVGITNARYAYKNFIMYNVSENYSPTSAWTRTGFSESQVIQKILLSSLIAQYGKYSRKLSGGLIGDVYLKPYSRIDDTTEDGRNYVVQGFEQGGSLLNEYSVEMYELKDADASVSAFSHAFRQEQFGVDFD